MSLKTWKKEFYPTKPKKRATKVEAIQHCLRKYEGTLKKNLYKHGVVLTNGDLYEASIPKWQQEWFGFDATTCALCEKYMDWSEKHACSKCPLNKLENNAQCNTPDSAYEVFIGGDNRPMLRKLRKLLKQAQEAYDK